MNESPTASAPAPESLKAAILASPGPSSVKEAAVLGAKGFCMGAADIVPGVSGGTVAFITGIYSQLIAAITSIDGAVVKSVLKLDIKGAVARVHVRFLAVLLFGVLAAAVSMARVIHYAMDQYPVPTWSLFMGLILASIGIVAREFSWKDARNLIGLAIGAAGAFFFVGMIPVQTPEAPWFLFLCGVIAISAMILPGLSGSFLLLILGKYAFITGAIKDPTAAGNLVIIATFGAGCAVGIMGFSRVLKIALTRAPGLTMALLTGFMIGAMRKVWPWKEVLETTVIRDKVHVLREANVLPTELNTEVGLAIGLMIVGIIAVMVLDRVANSRE